MVHHALVAVVLRLCTSLCFPLLHHCRRDLAGIGKDLFVHAVHLRMNLSLCGSEQSSTISLALLLVCNGKIALES